MPSPHHTSITIVIGHYKKTVTRSISATALYGTKRRGKLASNLSLDDEGKVRGVLSNKSKQKLGSSRSKRGGKNKNDDSASISPLLAEWAKEDGDVTVDNASAKSTLSSSDVFVPFNDDKKKKRKDKKDKRSSGISLSVEHTAQMDELLEQITEMLSTNNCNVSELVSAIASLADLNSSFSNDNVLLPTLKSILTMRPATKEEKQPSYRLAWVGSDNAVCHVGTSLHKVPLARLQEVYLLLGYNRWELLEVIRILGPFPNVRNTLKGDLKVKKLGGVQKREGVRMEIDYRSMIDGTGKEILAGKEDNVKKVELDVWFANEKAMVCTVPRGDEEDGGEGQVDPLGGDGSQILYFVAEEDLDDALDKLRAN